MKSILYILALASLTACNTNKPAPVQQYTATPNGLADLQKPGSATTAQANTSGGNAKQSNLLLNPKHGEPGHDCSIAVGAPLKAGTNANIPTASSAQNVTQVASQTANVTTSAQSVAATVNAKGQKLNPAHGQPNHRCDIAVGQPLNSKPIENVTATAKPQVNIPQPVNTQLPLVNEKGQKLNPAHGQPGHKCEIAVGAPLT